MLSGSGKKGGIACQRKQKRENTDRIPLGLQPSHITGVTINLSGSSHQVSNVTCHTQPQALLLILIHIHATIGCFHNGQ